MNVKVSFNCLKFLCVLLATSALAGCYSFSSLTKIPEMSENITQVQSDAKSDKIVYVSSINVKLNDGPANTSEGFTQKVITNLQKTNNFKEVTFGTYAKKPDVPFYDLTFNIEENRDAHSGSNLTKAFFTGLTFFVLAPVLPNEYDFSTNHYLLAQRPDGTKKEYKASCAGSATGTFPYVGLVSEYNKVAGAATEKCLASVINQFSSDK